MAAVGQGMDAGLGRVFFDEFVSTSGGEEIAQMLSRLVKIGSLDTGFVGVRTPNTDTFQSVKEMFCMILCCVAFTHKVVESVTADFRNEARELVAILSALFTDGRRKSPDHLTMLPGTEIDPLFPVFCKNVFGPIFTDLFIRTFDEFCKFNAALGAETSFDASSFLFNIKAIWPSLVRSSTSPCL